jgi:hypothetical protein
MPCSEENTVVICLQNEFWEKVEGPSTLVLSPGKGIRDTRKSTASIYAKPVKGKFRQMKKQPVTVFDFDACIQQWAGGRKLGLVQRHKLIYFAWRTYFIKTNGRVPFKTRIEAWPMGPVFVELQNNQTRQGDSSKLNELMTKCCMDTMYLLGHISGERLVRLLHMHCGEWQLARLFAGRGKRPEITRKLVRQVLNQPAMAFYA